MKRNYSRFYALLGRMPTTDKDGLKVDLVRQYTDNRTDSLREMTDKEYDAMCDGMQRQSNGYKAREIAREELRRKRSAALHLLQKTALTRPTGTALTSIAKIPASPESLLANSLLMNWTCYASN